MSGHSGRLEPGQKSEVPKPRLNPILETEVIVKHTLSLRHTYADIVIIILLLLILYLVFPRWAHGQRVGLGIIPPAYNGATVPVSGSKGELITVIDGNSATDCATGGGTTINTCQWNGSAWVVLGGGGGTGTVTHTGNLTAGYMVKGNGVADVTSDTQLDDDITVAGTLTYQDTFGMSALSYRSLALGVKGWAVGALYTTNAMDTGLSRDSAAVVDVGNGTQGDKSGTLNAAIVNAGTGLQIGAAAPTGDCPIGNNTNYVQGGPCVTAVTVPPQFSVSGTSTQAIVYPALPNSYTADPKAPYVQNLIIRHYGENNANANGGFVSFGDGFTTTGSFTTVAPAATLPAASKVSVANGSAVGIIGNAIQITGRTNGMRTTCYFFITISLATERVACGVSALSLTNTFTAANPNGNYVEIIYDSAGAINGGDATHWNICAGTATASQTCTVLTGSAVVATGTAYKLEIWEDVGNSRWTGWVNGASATNQASTNPAANVTMAQFFGAWGTNAGVSSVLNYTLIQTVADW